MPPILECVNIRHTFGRGELAEEVLRGVSMAFEAGEACVLMGPSGSGKTTLLSILGCLLTPTGGKLLLAGTLIDHAARGLLGRLRRDRIGFVFQHSQLLPFLTVAENLEVVGRNAGLSARRLAHRIEELMDRLGIAAMRHKKPDHLSGGQRQRVAIARAVLHRPAILLADEPTAALDWQHGEEAVRLLLEQAQAEGALLLTVTHDTRLLPLFGRVLRIEGGQLSEGSRP
jgi:putative ABC transport system ATP-binding protein